MIVFLSFIIFPISKLLACTNVFIYGNGNTAVARTTDYSVSTSMNDGLGVGLVGESNTADVNSYLPDKSKIPVQWVNKYGYIGYPWKGSPSLVDGINGVGVYAGLLYLGVCTKYPTYNAEDPRPCLGVLNVINYILATSCSVEDALQNLNKIQFVQNVVPAITSKESEGLYFLMPLHVVIRDKTGDSAVIEWLDGKTVIYRDPGRVLTNEPPLDWQQRNAEQYDKVDMRLLPPDWSPVSRFVRAYQIVSHLPVPESENDALRTAMSALQSVQAPPGVNEDPTLWESLSDLKNSIYYFLPLYKFNGAKISGFNPVTSWRTFVLNDILSKRVIPEGFVSAAIKPIAASNIKNVIILTDRSSID